MDKSEKAEKYVVMIQRLCPKCKGEKFTLTEKWQDIWNILKGEGGVGGIPQQIRTFDRDAVLMCLTDLHSKVSNAEFNPLAQCHVCEGQGYVYDQVNLTRELLPEIMRELEPNTDLNSDEFVIIDSSRC